MFFEEFLQFRVWVSWAVLLKSLWDWKLHFLTDIVEVISQDLSKLTLFLVLCEWSRGRNEPIAVWRYLASSMLHVEWWNGWLGCVHQRYTQAFRSWPCQRNIHQCQWIPSFRWLDPKNVLVFIFLLFVCMSPAVYNFWKQTPVLLTVMEHFYRTFLTKVCIFS